MKKTLLLVLVGIMSFSLLTGCGKSEEEKAADEMAQHMRDEAAEDGVDLDKMIEDEINAYEEKEKNFADKTADRKSKKEAINKKYDSKLEKLKAEYDSATTKKDIENAANEYNKLFTEKNKEYIEVLETKAEGNWIFRREYLTKIAFYEVAQKHASEYDILKLAYTSDSDLVFDDNKLAKYEESDSIMIMLHEGPSTLAYDKMLLIKNGTEVMELSASDFLAAGEEFEVYKANDKVIMLDVISNGDFKRYSFDYTGDKLELVEEKAGIEPEKPYSDRTFNSIDEDALKMELENM